VCKEQEDGLCKALTIIFAVCIAVVLGACTSSNPDGYAVNMLIGIGENHFDSRASVQQRSDTRGSKVAANCPKGKEGDICRLARHSNGKHNPDGSVRRH
jgi:hypothetical protein